MDFNNVLIVGATGKIGRELTRQLRERGKFVRTLQRRDDEQTRRLAHEAILLPTRKNEDAESNEEEANVLQSALLAVHVVISCVGANSSIAQTHDAVDFAFNSRLFDRCLNATSSVRFVVFVSVLHGALLRKSMPLVESRERVIDQLMNQRELAFAIVRPSLLLDDLFDIYRDIDVGDAPSIGPAASHCNPIAASDVARIIVHVLDNSRHFARKQLFVGGPDVYSWAALADLAADLAGRTRIGSLDKPAGGVVHGMVRSLSLLSSSSSARSDSVSQLLRAKLRTANLDCVGVPVGLHTVREFFIDKRIGSVLIDDNGVADATAPNDMPRIAGCSLLADATLNDRRVCATVRLTALSQLSPRVVTRLHTVKTESPAAVASPTRIPAEDANADGCFRFSLRVARPSRLRWRFIVDGRGAKRAVFRVLQHLPPSTSAQSSRTPSRAAAESTSATTTPRASEPVISHSTSELEMDRQTASPEPIHTGSPQLSPRLSLESMAFSPSSDADLVASPATLVSPVRRLLNDFDEVAATSAAPPPNEPLPQLFDSINTHSSFKSFKRAASVDLGALAERMRASLPIKSRSYRLRSYDACFLGKEAVDWLVEQRIVQTRDTAVVLGEVLRNGSFFRALNGATQFSDDAMFFRFAADEPPPVVLTTGLEDDDDEPAVVSAAAPLDQVDAATNCLYRDDECLKIDLVEGDCLLPAEGLYTLVWTSQVGRFALGRQTPARLMYSIALFDGANDADAIACVSDKEMSASAFRANSAFAALQVGELSLTDRELVWVSVRNGHWWRGRRASDGASGWFPAIAVERAPGAVDELLAALVQHRCDPRTEGIDLLAIHSSRNTLNPREAFRYPLVGFEMREEPHSEWFVPLARELHVQQLDAASPQRLEDLLCVAFRASEPVHLRSQSSLLLGDGEEFDIGSLKAFDADSLAPEHTLDTTARAVLSQGRSASDNVEYLMREVAFSRLGSSSARHSLLNEIATLKQLNGTCEWFARVVGVWRQHQRTALVYESGPTGGVLHSFIVRARDAPPLSDVLPVRHCLSLLLCVAKAMSCAHAAGLVLRDLQADTVLISDDPSTATTLVQARLFDVSRTRSWLRSAAKNRTPVADRTSNSSMSSGANAATSHTPQVPSAMRLDALRVSPPECVAYRKPCFEPLSDVWSFGCLMLELFSWHKAFEELDSEARILNALRTGQRPDIGSVMPRYRGRQLLALLESCLRPLPEPLVMLADPDSGRITMSQLLAGVEKLLHAAQS